MALRVQKVQATYHPSDFGYALMAGSSGIHSALNVLRGGQPIWPSTDAKQRTAQTEHAQQELEKLPNAAGRDIGTVQAGSHGGHALFR